MLYEREKLPVEGNLVFRMDFQLLSGFAVKPEGMYHSSNFTNNNYILSFFVCGSPRHICNKTETQLGPGWVLQRFPEVSNKLEFGLEETIQACIGLPYEFVSLLKRTKLVNENEPVFFMNGLSPFVSEIIEITRRLEAAPFRKLSPVIAHIYSLIVELHGRRIAADEDLLVIEKAKRLLGSSLDSKISVPEIAGECCMSYSNFRKIFRKKAGMSPMLYRIHRRIKDICKVLITRNLSISELAFQYGYSDSAALSRQFKKVTGMTLQEYKRKYSL